MRLLRILIGAAGVLLACYGVYRIYTVEPHAAVIGLVEWLIGALVLHDGILAPLTGVVGLITGLMRPRARRYVQGGLVVAMLITVIAVPMIHLQGKSPAAKALLRQDYRANLAILLGIVATATLLLYARRVLRDRAARSSR